MQLFNSRRFLTECAVPWSLLITCICILTSAVIAQAEDKTQVLSTPADRINANRSAQNRLLDTVRVLERTHPFTRETVERVTGHRLAQPINVSSPSAADCPYWFSNGSQSALLRDVWLTTGGNPPQPKVGRIALFVNPGLHIKRTDVMAAFGPCTDVQTHPYCILAGDQPIECNYSRGWGVLSFNFSSVEPHCLNYIVLNAH